MLVLTTINNQTLQPGEAVIFDSVIVKNSKCNCDSKNVQRLARVNNGLHQITFHGNITSATVPSTPSLAIAFDGVVAKEAIGQAAVPTAGYIYNIGMETATRICCCKCACDTVAVTVVNNSNVPVTVVGGATLLINRIG